MRVKEQGFVHARICSKGDREQNNLRVVACFEAPVRLACASAVVVKPVGHDDDRR